MPGFHWFSSSKPSRKHHRSHSMPPAPIGRADMNRYFTPFKTPSDLQQQPQYPHQMPAPGPMPLPPQFAPTAAPRGRQPHRRRANSTFAPAMHPILAASSPPTIRYKLLDHPSLICLTSTQTTLPPQFLAETATNPPLSTLTITCPRLMWHCTVRPSNGPYVTVFDVLETLHRFLRTNVSKYEYAGLHPDMQRQVTAAYHYRCSRFRHSYERQEERMKGLKRVDFLLEATRYQGLTPTNTSAVWTLNVS